MEYWSEQLACCDEHSELLVRKCVGSQSFTCIGTTCKPCCNEDSDFLGLGWSLRSCVSQKLPSNAHSVGQRTTSWAPFSAAGSQRMGTPRRETAQKQAACLKDKLDLLCHFSWDYTFFTGPPTFFFFYMIHSEGQYDNLLIPFSRFNISGPDCSPHIIQRQWSLNIKVVSFHPKIKFLILNDRANWKLHLLSSCPKIRARTLNLWWEGVAQISESTTCTFSMPSSKFQKRKLQVTGRLFDKLLDNFKKRFISYHPSINYLLNLWFPPLSCLPILFLLIKKFI